MKRNTLLLLFVMALPMMAPAQQYKKNYDNHDNRRGGNGGNNGGRQTYGEAGSAVTIFSESGERFQLILNGVKQNNYPQTRVRIEDLPFVDNDIQILFDDNVTPAINKRITFLDPVEGKAVNLVMKLTRDRGGYPRLCFVKMGNLEHDYRGEQGEYVMHYGRDNDHRHTEVNVVPPPPPPPPAPMAMDNTSFTAAVQAIKSSNWDETRLSTAKTIVANNYFNTDQVIQICKLFSWEENKLTFAEYVFKKTVDNNNYFKVNSVFQWDDNKTKLNDYVTANR